MTRTTTALVTTLALTLSLGLALTACSGDGGSQTSGDDGSSAASMPAQTRAHTPDVGGRFVIPSGRPGVAPIKVTVVAKGTGTEARSGDTVAMHYIGTFMDGKVFDSSRKTGQAFEFRLGTGGVIAGWDLVVERMHIGDRWTVVIPSDLAYGERGHPAGIPGGADLNFDMELLRVR